MYPTDPRESIRPQTTSKKRIPLLDSGEESLPTMDMAPESRDLENDDFAEFIPETPHASYHLQNIIGRGSEGVSLLRKAAFKR